MPQVELDDETLHVEGGKKKIVILGGGAGGLAARGADHVEGWESRYEVTVYQLGWRLGGKGMTGRNPRYGGRVEEHGEHMWSGFYPDAFHMIRRCYKELVDRGLREPGARLATWKQAFLPFPHASFAQRGFWRPFTLWQVDLRPRDCDAGPPGQGGRPLTPFEMLIAMFPFFVQFLGTERTWRQAPSENSGCLLRSWLAVRMAGRWIEHAAAKLVAKPIVLLHRLIHHELKRRRPDPSAPAARPARPPPPRTGAS